jgi:Flp pilus assembly protein TadG
MVETALMISVLLVMLLGIIGFGHALYTYHFVSNTAREAARWASVRGSACLQDTPIVSDCPAKVAEIKTYVQNLATGIGLNPSSVTVKSRAFASPSAVYAPKCPSAPPAPPGCVVEVQVRYRYQFLVPLLPAAFTMQSTSQMVVSQ